MAPLGRNFLKARLKNRSKDAEETPGKEIQVLVFQEEKVVCGVTKHTTCADVVQALLEDHKNIPESKRTLHGEAKEFCLLERWKGFERALPPLTRILRLWNAWGDERPFIRFVLVKASKFMPSSTGAKRTLKSRVVKSKRWEQGPAHCSKTLAVERQKKMVKKAFRKLEKMQKGGTSEGSEEIDRMVRLIISQDHTIRQQIYHMRELDLELEHMEQQFRENPDPCSSTAKSSSSLLLSTSVSQGEEQLQEYLYASSGITQLELQVRRHQELIDELSRDIDLELKRNSWTPDSGELEGAAAAGLTLDLESTSSLSSVDASGMEGLRSELDLSMRTGLLLYAQSQDLERELQWNNTLMQSRNQEYQHLMAQLGSLQLGDCPEPASPTNLSLKNSTRVGVSQQATGKLRQNLSPTDVTDTDSDTGISSTHSQDSLSPCVDRQLPLDSDV
ncbi:ras association domain-containing protein 9 [Electrophorus electricus]|uniref:Ras-associating domain-containing protein n=1 Tax=Electrophorus electricus TaxID=8005 RepID=A0A4W4EIB3_ELEEL|nr:ras association domain-containing protein 9 [Electrophorus electricus]